LLSSLEGEPAADCAVSSGLSIPAPSSPVAAAAGVLYNSAPSVNEIVFFGGPGITASTANCLLPDHSSFILKPAPTALIFY